MDDEDDFIGKSAAKIRDLLGAEEDVDVVVDEDVLISDDDDLIEEEEEEEGDENGYHDELEEDQPQNDESENNYVESLSKNVRLPEDDDSDLDLDSEYLDLEEDPDEENDIFSNSYRNALRAAAGMRVKKPTKKRSGAVERTKLLNPEVRQKLSEANELYVDAKIDEAQALYKEILAIDPRNYAALKTLGAIAKEKGRLSHCCVYWILAAQISPKELDLWAMTAEISVSLGHMRQAFYCYTRAMRYDTPEHKFLWERTRLYEETGQTYKALCGYQKLLLYFPTNQQIVIEIAKLYSDLNRVSEAIDIFINILNDNIAFHADPEADPEEKDFPDFDWSELNILTELYYKNEQFALGLATMKKTARWLQNRSDETFWDDALDDAEFDERREENPQFKLLPQSAQERSNYLPIDIRVKMGLFRLRLENTEEAFRHFQALLEEPEILEFEDLYLQVANSLESAGHFEEALRYYVPLFQNSESITLEILSAMGKCYQEIGDYQQAAVVYDDVLQIDPQNINAMMALAETYYHLGDMEVSRSYSAKTRELSNQRMKKSQGTLTTEDIEKLSELLREPTPVAPTAQESPALFTDLKRTKKPNRQRKAELSAGEKKELERKLITDTISKYKRLKKLEPAVSRRDPMAAEMWLRVASDLIEVICGVKSFFIRDRAKAHEEELYVSKKNLKMDITRRLERLNELHELANSKYLKIDPSLTYEEGKSYRGLTFDQWHEIFMQYGLLCAMFDDAKEAIQVIEIASSLIEFHKDETKLNLIGLVRLSIHLITKKSEFVMLSVRELLNTHRFSREVFKLFPLSFPSGRRNYDYFISANHQKYFLRQVKAWDVLRLNKKINGLSKILKEEINFDYSSVNPYLMAVYLQVMLSGKSYLASLFFLLKIYDQFKYDPMVCLLLGLACIHRAMQRSSENRHMLILQGITYFDEYKKLRMSKGAHEEQETDYNFGRFFHQLSLVSIAVEYYRKVLYNYSNLDETFDLKREAAYNLSNIYQISGNSVLAKRVIDEFLTV